MSKITVNGIWAEDLFEWFDSNVSGSGGDGAALIVCKNYKEVAGWFVDWWAKKHNLDEKGNRHIILPSGKPHVIQYGSQRFPHPRDEYDNIVNYHDMNENYMFSDTEHNMFSGDYTFVVTGECKFAFDKKDVARVILPVNS